MESNVLQMNGVEKPGKKGISGSTLKLVAIFTMLIDHTAATILQNTLIQRGLNELDATNTQATLKFYADNGVLYATEFFMRMVGRLAFPIFCFLLVEGMIHTHSKRKYATRLAIFALVSEIPFDLAFHSKPFYWGYQNVFFTLLIGLLVMIGFQTAQDKLKDKKWLPVLAVVGAVALGSMVVYFTHMIVGIVNVVLNGMGNHKVITISLPVNIILGSIFSIIALLIWYGMIRKKSLQTASLRFTDMGILAAGFILAQVLSTDYAGFGVLTIAVMYGLRKSHFKAMLGGCITLTIMSIGEGTSFLDLLLIRKYNGKRGINLKYVFYLFYPVHLFLLYLICYFMKLV